MLKSPSTAEQMPVGYALRVLYRRGRRFDDLVILEPKTMDEKEIEPAPGGEVRVLSQEPIFPESMTGPVLVVDREVPNRFEDPKQWIDRALSDIIPGFRTDDVRTPMADEEFWELIALLGGRVEDSGLAQLVDALSSMTYLRILAFRDALWEKLHRLDHPENTVGFGDGHISADASLYYRCEIVAAGEAAYQEALEHPRKGVGDDGAAGEGLLGVAEDAAPQGLHHPQVHIETGQNPAHWPDVVQYREPWMVLPSPGPFTTEVQTRFDREDRRNLDARLANVGFTSFVAYAFDGEGRVRELMGCLMAGSFANAREELGPFLRARLQPGETLDDRLLVWQDGAAMPMKDTSLTGVSRRSSLSMQGYIDLYINGQL